jgi:hypothetical protein
VGRDKGNTKNEKITERTTNEEEDMMDSNNLFAILKMARTQTTKLIDKRVYGHIDYPFSRWWELVCFFMAGVLWFFVIVDLASLMV